jgi:hypothetical protein
MWDRPLPPNAPQAQKLTQIQKPVPILFCWYFKLVQIDRAFYIPTRAVCSLSMPTYGGVFSRPFRGCDI